MDRLTNYVPAREPIQEPDTWRYCRNCEYWVQTVENTRWGVCVNPDPYVDNEPTEAREGCYE